MKFQTLILSCFLIAQSTPSLGQSAHTHVAAGLETLSVNSQEIRSTLGLYAPADVDLARFIGAEGIREFRENTMGLSMDKNAQYVIATVSGREVLLRSSSIQRDGVFDLKASGGISMTEGVPGNQFLKELQGARATDALKLHLTVLADGRFKYEVLLQSIYDNVENRVLSREIGYLRLKGSRIDRALSERNKNPLTIDTRDAVRKVEKR